MTGNSVESWFTFSDGLEAYERTWSPKVDPCAHIILLHGWSDRVDLYDAWCSALVSSHPVRVIGYDRRGWGKTVKAISQRGATGPNSKVLADLDEFIQHIASDIPNLDATPLFLMGHSMGGQESLYYALNTSTSLVTNRRLLSGMILDAPYVALCKQPSIITVMLGRLMALFAPHRQMKQYSNPSEMSRDPVVCQAWADDELCHDTGDLESLIDTLVREAELTTLADSRKTAPASLTTTLPFPVMWAHGTADVTVSYPISRQLFDRLDAFNGEDELKTFVSYDRWYHSLHSEPDGAKEQFAHDVGEWVRKTVAKISKDAKRV